MIKAARKLIGAFLLLALFAPAAFATAASDDFAGTGALSAAWTDIRAGMTRSSGHAVSTSAFGIAMRNDITPTAAQYSEAVVGVSAAIIFSGQSFLFVRMVDIDNYYAANLDDLRHSATLIRRVGGVDSIVYTVSMPAGVVAGDTLKLSVNGSYVFTLSRNGTSFGSFDDAALGTVSGGKVGMGGAGLTTNQGEWDYWEGGDASVGCTAPNITVNPSNTTVTAPSTANFTASVTGTLPSYQWQRGTTNVSAGTGGTTLSYTTAATSVGSDNGATFRLIAHNSCGDDTSTSATLTVTTAPASGLPYNENFEANPSDSTCWASRPNGDENSAGCRGVTNIGKGFTGQHINQIGRWGIAHSGSWANRIVFDTNEQEARYSVHDVNSNTLFIREWLYFDTAYDHAFGEKILRMSAVDSAGIGGCSPGSLFWDIIFYIRSATQTVGKDDMGSLTGEANGGTGGVVGGGGFVTVNYTFPRGVWFELQVGVTLNGPGDSTGTADIWVNNVLIKHQGGIYNMRTSSRGCGYSAATDTHKIMVAKPVGWYSNGGCEPSGCTPHPQPSAPSKKYVDDVCMASSKCASLVGGGGLFNWRRLFYWLF